VDAQRFPCPWGVQQGVLSRGRGSLAVGSDDPLGPLPPSRCALLQPRRAHA
jgi:hypothetical protein